MSDLDPLRVLNVPGRWVLAPTDLSADFPYGGTAIGYVGGSTINLNKRYEPIETDEYGLRRVDMVEMPSTATLGFILRQWDDDVYRQVFSTTSSASEDYRRIDGGAYLVPRLLAGDSISRRILFVPDDMENPAFIAYRAAPMLDQTANINLSLNTELNLAMIFMLLPYSATTEAYQMGPFGLLQVTPS